MGERRTVCMNYEDDNIYIYSHWGGKSLEKILAEALNTEQARDRWHDYSYLNRIIIELLPKIFGDEGLPTGWGVTSKDNISTEYPTINVDVKNGIIIIENESLTFEDFINKHLIKEED